MPKKALIVSNISGMISSFLKNDVELLLEKGYEITCACNTDYPNYDTAEFFRKYNINVCHIDFPVRELSLPKIASSFFTLSKLLAQEKFDIVHSHTTIAAAITRQSADRYRKYGMKVFYTSHGLPFYEGLSWKKAFFYQKIEDHYSKYTDAFITICSEDFENAKKMHCKNVYKINGVGVDTARFVLKNFDRDAYRRKLGFDSDDIIILSIGELNTNKNHQIVIRAIAQLGNPKIKYVICGKEISEIGKREELKKLASNLGVDLTLLGFRKDIPEICHSSDIGAFPSQKEGLGLSAIEMLASGLPVAGSNRQGIKDYVIDGKTGYLADPNSEYSFAEALEKTIQLKGLLETKDYCIKTASNFDVNVSRNQMKNIYSEILRY